jgi:hypothetical protein
VDGASEVAAAVAWSLAQASNKARPYTRLVCMGHGPLC